jgi:hypothetical protein
MTSAIVTDIATRREDVIQATESLELAICNAVKRAAEKVGKEFFVHAVCDREEQCERVAA